MKSQDKDKEYEHNVWEIYRKEWETATPEKKIELNKRMRRWQELMKSGLTASQAYYKAMEEESDKPPIYKAVEEGSDYRVVEHPPDKRPAITSAPRMRKAPLIFLSLALVVAIVYGFVITGDRNALNTELESVQNVLASTQTQLSSTKQSLASTQAELTSTQLGLALTEAELSSTKQKLTSTQGELSSTKQTLASVQNDLLATKTQMNAIDAKLKLYEDTMGIKIFSGVQPLARGAGPIELVNNSAATNPTWQQLMSFLRADPTDDRTWTEGIFVSGDFAEMLHNNAEAAGIRAAAVGVFFEGEDIGHGLNAFKTTDRGLVYVEPQTDGIVYMVKGKEFGSISLGQNLLFDYGYYEKMKADWDSYEQKLAAYNRDVQTYNAGYDAEQRRRASLTFQQWLSEEQAYFDYRMQQLRTGVVKVPDIGTPLWFRFMEASLKQQEKVLDSLRAQLEQLWEPMGITERIEIYW